MYTFITSSINNTTTIKENTDYHEILSIGTTQRLTSSSLLIDGPQLIRQAIVLKLLTTSHASSQATVRSPQKWLLPMAWLTECLNPNQSGIHKIMG